MRQVLVGPFSGEWRTTQTQRRSLTRMLPGCMQGLELIFVAQLLISVMLSLVFLVVWQTVDTKPHALSWSLTFFVLTINAILNATKSAFPTPELYWVIVNAASLLAQGLALTGFCQRSDVRVPTRALISLLIAVEAFVVYFTYIRFHEGLRMVAIPWSGAFVMFTCAWVVCSAERRTRAAEWGAATLLVVYGLAQFTAGTVALMQGATRVEGLLSLYSTINFLSIPAALAGLGIFGVLLIADDLSDEMRTLALTDRLTSVMNRRGFESAAKAALARARRSRHSTSIAIADLDFFKRVNDNHGHATGDKALVAVARALEAEVRTGDIIGRIGGEEFALLLPRTAPGDARRIAERLRRRIESRDIDTPTGAMRVTASIGVALAVPTDSVADALDRADAALYVAKAAGRNRVELISAAEPESDTDGGRTGDERSLTAPTEPQPLASAR